jgi:predicted CXXCH cytochrome family protein
MKLRNIVIVGLCMCFIAVPSLGQISGSDHDFSSESWNPTGEMCNVCHTPHNSDTTVSDAPLWSHEVTVATFTLYSTATLNATVGQPSGSSKLCLSCHDGTVAVDNFGGATGGTDFLSGNDLLGIDLSGEHPISFTYDSTLATADGGLYDPTTQVSGLGSTIQADLLIGDKLECSSCHDVHNSSGESNLLQKSNAASALCLTCHNK